MDKKIHLSSKLSFRRKKPRDLKTDERDAGSELSYIT